VAKEELLEFDGVVTEILPDARYRVQLDNGHNLVAYTAGKMKKNRIKTLAGDRVTVEVSPYDLEKGRLIFRHKDDRGSSAPRPPQRPASFAAAERRAGYSAACSACASRPARTSLPGRAPVCSPRSNIGVPATIVAT